ncbi:MAG: 3-oxoadipate enol-lactonase, partial [Myxococcota bacterium]
GKPDARTIVVVNGLGGNLTTWRHQLNHLVPDYRLVTWDYRGLFGSALAPGQSDVSLGIDRHADDAFAVMADRGLGQVILMGWSMGVQLNFELYRRAPERMDAIIQIAGSYGRSLSTTRFGRHGEKFILPAMGVMRHVMNFQGHTIAKAIGSPLVLAFAKRTGFVAPSLDEALVADIMKDYVTLDFTVYNKILATLGEHDAESQLPNVLAPVLVIAGDNDPMTPHWLSEKMARDIPDAELELIGGASHYLPAEFPARVNARISEFLGRKLAEAPAA